MTAASPLVAQTPCHKESPVLVIPMTVNAHVIVFLLFGMVLLGKLSNSYSSGVSLTCVFTLLFV